MQFDNNLKQYTRAYSFYQLMNDIAYSPVTDKYLLDLQNEDNAKISFRCKFNVNENRYTSRNLKNKWDNKLNSKGLVQKFYPENCQSLNMNANILDSTIFGLDISGQNARAIIETIQDEVLYTAWRNKIRREIKQWHIIQNIEKQRAIVLEIIFKLYMSPKFYFCFDADECPSSSDWKYGKKSIFELLDYDMNNDIMILLASENDFLLINDEKQENKYSFFEDIIKIEEEHDKTNGSSLAEKDSSNVRSICIYRNILNNRIEKNNMYIYGPQGEEIKYIPDLDTIVHNDRLTEIEKRIIEMSENDPIELLISMIIFSIALQYLVSNHGNLFVYSENGNKKHLLYKLFFKERTLNKNNKLSNLNDEIYNILENAFRARENYNINGEMKYLNEYLCVLRDWGMGIYDIRNRYCYANVLLCDMNRDFLIENYLDKERLLNTVFEYCKNNDINNVANSERYGIGLIKYARYILDNKLKKDYHIISDILNLLDKIKKLNFVEIYILYGDIYRNGIEGIEKFAINYEKAYKMYTKAYSMLGEQSIIDNYIIPCLEEWCYQAKNSNIMSNYMDKSIYEWKDIWSNLKNEKGDFVFIQNKFEEKCREVLEDKIKKLEEIGVHIDLPIRKVKDERSYNSIVVPENAKDIYIVIGTGKASRVVIDSVKKEKNSQVLIVPYENEMESFSSIIKWYENDDNITVFTCGIENVLDGEGLELYNLYNKLSNICIGDSVSSIFESYLNNIKKIHFVALDDTNKADNLDVVVKIINSTYIRYYFYNLLSGCTGRKFDFSEVDIVINSQEQTAWYIDSVMNRFKDEFYLKIKYVSPSELAVRELLTEYPVFLTDLNELKKENGKLENTRKHNILILGSNRLVVPTLIKELLQVGGYMRDDIIRSGNNLDNLADHKYEEFEKSIGKDLNITVIDEKAYEIRESLLYDSPDIFNRELEYIHTIPDFYDFPIYTSSFIELFYKKRLGKTSEDNSLDKENEISDVINNANYIVVAMEDTENAINLAMKIRNIRYRLNIKDEPIISVYTPDRNQDENINQFTIEKNLYKDAFNRSYHINMFGKYQNIYSKKRLYDDFLDKISIELHIGDAKSIVDKRRDYYKGVYNHRSCDCRSLAFIYVMYSVLGTKMIYDFELNNEVINKNIYKANNYWSMELFKKNISKYLEEYEKVIAQRGWIDALAVEEHNRWNYMLISEGYTGHIGIKTQSEDSIKKTIVEWSKQIIDDRKENKLQIAKVHFAIRPFYMLGDRVEIDSLYFLKYARNKIDNYVNSGIIKEFLSGNELDCFLKNKYNSQNLIYSIKNKSTEIIETLIKELKEKKYSYNVILTEEDISAINSKFINIKDRFVENYIKESIKNDLSDISEYVKKNIYKSKKIINEFNCEMYITEDEINKLNDEIEKIKRIFLKIINEYCIVNSKINTFEEKIRILAINEIQRLEQNHVIKESDLQHINRQISETEKKVYEIVKNNYEPIELNGLRQLLSEFMESIIKEIQMNHNILGKGTKEKINKTSMYKLKLEFDINENGIKKEIIRIIDDIIKYKYTTLVDELKKLLESEKEILNYVKQSKKSIKTLACKQLDNLENDLSKYYVINIKMDFYDELLGYETEFKNIIKLADEIVKSQANRMLEKKLDELRKDYNKELDKFKELELFKKNKIVTVGIDEFEKLMDECYFEIPNFKVIKNRYYDRRYAYEMAVVMKKILDKDKQHIETTKSTMIYESIK